jgi:hypothetical protein
MIGGKDKRKREGMRISNGDEMSKGDKMLLSRLYPWENVV